MFEQGEIKMTTHYDDLVYLLTVSKIESKQFQDFILKVAEKFSDEVSHTAETNGLPKFTINHFRETDFGKALLNRSLVDFYINYINERHIDFDHTTSFHLSTVSNEMQSLVMDLKHAYELVKSKRREIALPKQTEDTFRVRYLNEMLSLFGYELRLDNQKLSSWCKLR